jgi:hypothetical protein
MLDHIEKRISELGGMRPFNTKKVYHPLTHNEIKSIEKRVKGELPSDFKAFMFKYGASYFNNWLMIHPKRKLPHGISRDNISRVIGFVGSSKDGNASIVYNLDLFDRNLPDKFLPISNEDGNLICIDLNDNKKDYGKIYFWDYENRWDEEEYEEEHGKKMTKAAKFENLYLLADSFSNLFDHLEINQEYS